MKTCLAISLCTGLLLAPSVSFAQDDFSGQILLRNAKDELELLSFLPLPRGNEGTEIWGYTDSGADHGKKALPCDPRRCARHGM